VLLASEELQSFRARCRMDPDHVVDVVDVLGRSPWPWRDRPDPDVFRKFCAARSTAAPPPMPPPTTRGEDVVRHATREATRAIAAGLTAGARICRTDGSAAHTPEFPRCVPALRRAVLAAASAAAASAFLPRARSPPRRRNSRSDFCCRTPAPTPRRQQHHRRHEAGRDRAQGRLGGREIEWVAVDDESDPPRPRPT